MARRLRPEGLEFVETAPVRLVFTHDVAAPPKEVYEVLEDVRRLPAWHTSVVYARPFDDGLGRLVRIQGRFWFRETFLATDAPTRYAYRVDRTNFPGLRALVEEWRLIPLEPTGGRDAGTRVQWTYAADAVALTRFLLKRGGRRGIGRSFHTAVANLDRQLTGASGS
ncbi:polyketide cyclase [Streptomyces aureoverticillatus]|nr:polyketide cyclase [Streptomyces aureoverticillatus]